MQSIVYVEVSLAFGAIGPGASAALSTGVQGAVPGEPVVLGLPPTGPCGPLQYCAYCAQADAITVRAYNPSSAVVDAPAADFTLAQLTF